MIAKFAFPVRGSCETAMATSGEPRTASFRESGSTARNPTQVATRGERGAGFTRGRSVVQSHLRPLPVSRMNKRVASPRVWVTARLHGTRGSPLGNSSSSSMRRAQVVSRRRGRVTVDAGDLGRVLGLGSPDGLERENLLARGLPTTAGHAPDQPHRMNRVQVAAEGAPGGVIRALELRRR